MGRLGRFQQTFYCHECSTPGQPSKIEKGFYVSGGESENGPQAKFVKTGEEYDWNAPSNLQRCPQCHQWTCYRCMLEGTCSSCTPEWKKKVLAAEQRQKQEEAEKRAREIAEERNREAEAKRNREAEERRLDQVQYQKLRYTLCSACGLPTRMEELGARYRQIPPDMSTCGKCGKLVHNSCLFHRTCSNCASKL